MIVQDIREHQLDQGRICPFLLIRGRTMRSVILNLITISTRLPRNILVCFFHTVFYKLQFKSGLRYFICNLASSSYYIQGASGRENKAYCYVLVVMIFYQEWFKFKAVFTHLGKKWQLLPLQRTKYGLIIYWKYKMDKLPSSQTKQSAIFLLIHSVYTYMLCVPKRQWRNCNAVKLFRITGLILK